MFKNVVRIKNLKNEKSKKNKFTVCFNDICNFMRLHER